MAATYPKGCLDPDAPEFFPSVLTSSFVSSTCSSPSTDPPFYYQSLPPFQLSFSPHFYCTFNLSTHNFPLPASPQPPTQSHSYLETKPYVEVEENMVGRKDVGRKYRNDSSGGSDVCDYRGEKAIVGKEHKVKLRSVDDHRKTNAKSFAARKKKEGSSVEPEPVEKDGNNTTVMIRNIPSKYTRDMMLKFLDQHCMKQNQQLEKHSSIYQVEDNTISAFDFFYLPIDFYTGMNKGYAFVNFTSSEAMWKFYEETNNQTWDLFHSNKIRQIAHARLQGKAELVRHFENMRFPCESDEVLPVYFSPPRDGSREWVEPTTVGRKIGRRKYKSSHHSNPTIFLSRFGSSDAIAPVSPSQSFSLVVL